jgi:flavin-dependent thymidylate synthase
MKMKVELISYTPSALTLLLSTKNTRLAGGEDPATWTEERRQQELSYMLGTIKSSWEFVDYTFRISGVTRAFTHQLVRTRTGSYAQEAQRVVDVRDHEVVVPEGMPEQAQKAYRTAVDEALYGYGKALEYGAAPQDARGVLPTNITTSIVAKFNLRTLHETAKLRLCTRTQGEYQNVFRRMRELVLAIHPWTDGMLEVACAADGRCAFPNYGPEHCPVWFPELDHTARAAEAKQRFWAAERYEAAPRTDGSGRSIG